MEPDTAADLLGELEPEQAEAVLEQMDEADAVAPLLAYDEESAGGIMNLPPPSLRRQMTIARRLRIPAGELPGRFRDVLSLRAGSQWPTDRRRQSSCASLGATDQSVEEIMERDVVSVSADTDQEEVAQLFARYDLLALPVVDDEHRLVGHRGH